MGYYSKTAVQVGARRSNNTDDRLSENIILYGKIIVFYA